MNGFPNMDAAKRAARQKNGPKDATLEDRVKGNGHTDTNGRTGDSGDAATGTPGDSADDWHPRQRSWAHAPSEERSAAQAQHGQRNGHRWGTRGEENGAEDPRADEGTLKQEDNPASRIHIVNPAELEHVPVPPREWIVTDWLPIGNTVGLYGDGAAGKSLLAQQLQTSCATRVSWCNQTPLRCKSFGLYCEDTEAELHRRQADINATFGLLYPQLADMRWVSGVGDDWTLVQFTNDGRMVTTDKWHWLVREVTAFGAKLVVLDTAADVFGGNENDRSHVRRFVSLLTGLAHDIHSVVLLNCHPSRAGLRSGDLDGASTGWNNSVRARLSLARPAGEGVPDDTRDRILTRRKANYASVGEELRIRWTKGAFVPVTPDGGVSGVLNRANAEAVFLTLLDRATAAGQRLSDSKHAGKFAPKAFAIRPDAEGYTIKDFEKAMAALFAAKKIMLREYGRRGDARQQIVRVPDAAANDL